MAASGEHISMASLRKAWHQQRQKISAIAEGMLIIASIKNRLSLASDGGVCRRLFRGDVVNRWWRGGRLGAKTDQAASQNKLMRTGQ